MTQPFSVPPSPVASSTTADAKTSTPTAIQDAGFKKSTHPLPTTDVPSLPGVKPRHPALAMQHWTLNVKPAYPVLYTWCPVTRCLTSRRTAPRPWPGWPPAPSSRVCPRRSWQEIPKMLSQSQLQHGTRQQGGWGGQITIPSKIKAHVQTTK